MDFEALGKLTNDVNALQKQQTVMLDRLEKLNEKSDSVSEVVYGRILKDYQHNLEQLNMELSPLYDQLKLRKAELMESIDEVEEELKAYMVEKEEISVRAELGEFTEKKAASKIDALEKENKDKFDRLNKLKSELEKVDEVLAAEVGSGEMPVSVPESVEELGDDFPEAVADDIQEDPAGDEPSTLSEEMPQEDLLPPPPPTDGPVDETEKTILDLGEELQQGSTVLYRPPKMGVTNIGSGQENDIRIDDPSIAEKHAQITFGPDGFTIYDYNTPGGIQVNGQRISEHLVQSGDKIQIGDAELRFEN